MHLINDLQVTVIETALGTALYDVIVAGGLSGNYQTLLDDYIKPILWHSTYAAFLRDSIVIAGNAGVFSHTPDGTVPAEIESIKYAAKTSQSRADIYLDRMTRFLCDKQISEYIDAQANDYDIKPDRDINTISGWYL